MSVAGKNKLLLIVTRTVCTLKTTKAELFIAALLRLLSTLEVRLAELGIRHFGA